MICIEEGSHICFHNFLFFSFLFFCFYFLVLLVEAGRNVSSNFFFTLDRLLFKKKNEKQKSMKKLEQNALDPFSVREAK